MFIKASVKAKSYLEGVRELIDYKCKIRYTALDVNDIPKNARN
jgi:hypothetical protein